MLPVPTTPARYLEGRGRSATKETMCEGVDHRKGRLSQQGATASRFRTSSVFPGTQRRSLVITRVAQAHRTGSGELARFRLERASGVALMHVTFPTVHVSFPSDH